MARKLPPPSPQLLAIIERMLRLSWKGGDPHVVTAAIVAQVKELIDEGGKPGLLLFIQAGIDWIGNYFNQIIAATPHIPPWERRRLFGSGLLSPPSDSSDELCELAALWHSGDEQGFATQLAHHVDDSKMLLRLTREVCNWINLMGGEPQDQEDVGE